MPRAQNQRLGREFQNLGLRRYHLKIEGWNSEKQQRGGIRAMPALVGCDVMCEIGEEEAMVMWQMWVVEGRGCGQQISEWIECRHKELQKLMSLWQHDLLSSGNERERSNNAKTKRPMFLSLITISNVHHLTQLLMIDAWCPSSFSFSCCNKSTPHGLVLMPLGDVTVCKFHCECIVNQCVPHPTPQPILCNTPSVNSSVPTGLHCWFSMRGEPSSWPSLLFWVPVFMCCVLPQRLHNWPL